MLKYDPRHPDPRLDADAMIVGFKRRLSTADSFRAWMRDALEKGLILSDCRLYLPLLLFVLRRWNRECRPEVSTRSNTKFYLDVFLYSFRSWKPTPVPATWDVGEIKDQFLSCLVFARLLFFFGCLTSQFYCVCVSMFALEELLCKPIQDSLGIGAARVQVEGMMVVLVLMLLSLFSSAT